MLDITGNISGTGGLTMAGLGTLQPYGSNSYAGGTKVNSGTLLVSSAGGLPANKPVTVAGGKLEVANTVAGSNLHIGALTITGGKAVLDNGVTAGTQSPLSSVNVTSLAISGTGRLDIGNNHLFINYGRTRSDRLHRGPDQQWLRRRRLDRNGNHVHDRPVQFQDYGIGYADSADPGNPAGLASGHIEIMYTLLGDANLDGKVNSVDFAILATQFQPGGYRLG